MKGNGPTKRKRRNVDTIVTSNDQDESTARLQEETEKSSEEILQPKNIQKLNLLLDPSKANERNEATKLARENYNKQFGGMDMKVSYQNLFEILWYSQLLLAGWNNRAQTCRVS